MDPHRPGWRTLRYWCRLPPGSWARALSGLLRLVVLPANRGNLAIDLGHGQLVRAFAFGLLPHGLQLGRRRRQLADELVDIDALLLLGAPEIFPDQFA